MVEQQYQKIRIKLKSYDHRVLDESVKKIVDTVKHTGVNISGPVLLPVQVRYYTLLRSPHVDKKSREQFEIRIHKRLIDILDPTPATIEQLMNLQLPSGIEVEIKMAWN